VADDEDARLDTGFIEKLARGASVEAARNDVADHGFLLEVLACDPRCIDRADERAGEHALEPHLEARERDAGRPCLILAAFGEPALGIGSGVVRLGLAVSQEPELRSHGWKLSRGHAARGLLHSVQAQLDVQRLG
jgi:hypothetical protein